MSSEESSAPVAVEVAPVEAPPASSNVEETPEIKTEVTSPEPPPQNGGGPPSRVKLSDEQLETATKEELLSHWREQDTYLDTIEAQSSNLEKEALSLKENIERIKQQHTESQHREKVLVRRLASKEQEMQDYASQLAELRAAQVPSAAALRSALLDPAASLLVQKLRHELAAIKTRLEETQNELSAWKFTPDSNTGKRLMAKCRLLYQENEELGRVIASGRLAKLEGELALQKSFSDEVKKSQSELDEFLQELDEDVEGMQGTIYFLQQQLKAAKETVASLTQENTNLRQATGAVHQEEEKESHEEWGGGGIDEDVTQDSAAELADENEQPTQQEEEEKPMETEQLKEEEKAVEETSCDPESTGAEEEPPSKRTRLSSTENGPEEDQ